jgi:hypothetical protein
MWSYGIQAGWRMGDMTTHAAALLRNPVWVWKEYGVGRYIGMDTCQAAVHVHGLRPSVFEGLADGMVRDGKGICTQVKRHGRGHPAVSVAPESLSA